MSNEISRAGKIRVILFAVFHAILIYFVIGYTIETCGIWQYKMPYTENGVYIDGSYFPPIFSNAFILFANGLLDFAVMFFCVLATAGASCALMLPLTFITKKKINAASGKEIKITKIILFSWAAVYITGLVITGGKSLIYILILIAFPLGAELVFYFILKKQHRGNSGKE